MLIRKPNIPIKRKESNSLAHQLLFIRRPDITLEMRLDLAIAGFGISYRNGTIAELGRRYNISHTFIYNLSYILRSQLTALFSPSQNSESSVLEKLLSSIRFLLDYLAIYTKAFT